MTTDPPRTSAEQSGPAAAALSALNRHGRCLLCGEHNPASLGLVFAAQPDRSVRARFAGRRDLQGYDGLLHGGVIAALLDAAMTHCLFHRGVRALTADLRVRYREPVPCDAEVELVAWVVVPGPPVHRLRAELRRAGRVLAWAEAKFLPQAARAEA